MFLKSYSVIYVLSKKAQNTYHLITIVFLILKKLSISVDVCKYITITIN